MEDQIGTGWVTQEKERGAVALEECVVSHCFCATHSAQERLQGLKGADGNVGLQSPQIYPIPLRNSTSADGKQKREDFD